MRSSSGSQLPEGMQACVWVENIAQDVSLLPSLLHSAGGSASQLAAGVLPFARVLAAAGVAGAAALLPQRWTHLWDGQLSEQEAGGQAAAQGLGEGLGGVGAGEGGGEEEEGIEES